MPLPSSHYSIVWAWTAVPFIYWERWNNVSPKSTAIMSFGFMQINQMSGRKHFYGFYIQNSSQFRSQCQKNWTKKVSDLSRRCDAVLKQQLQCVRCWCESGIPPENSVIFEFSLFVCLFCFVLLEMKSSIYKYIFACVSALFKRFTNTHWCLDVWKKERTKRKSWSRNICNTFIMYFYILFCTWKITLNDLFR